jgi:hypothetical protein
MPTPDPTLAASHAHAMRAARHHRTPHRKGGFYAALARHHAASHWTEKPARVIPPRVEAALDTAIGREGVPAAWHDGLSFIVAQESSGQVDARNPHDEARGLFQLTSASYHYNPHGAASFGNAEEEAQGGIRYIRQRYGTADAAAAFWRSHHWY